MQDSFGKIYKKLNPEQKRAVDIIEGPVMVVAGPGTGKTQVLTLRIANILRETDTEPRSILALTFTESAVVSMRRRLADLIGSPAYSVTISTFHSFCNDVIKNEPEAFPRIIGATHISEVDQIELIELAVNELKLDALKPFGDPTYYVRSILRAINELKREDVTPEKFIKIVKAERKAFELLEDKYHTKGKYEGRMKGDAQRIEKKVKKTEELTLVYGKYEEALMRERLYDYTDMIGEVVHALKDNPDLLLVLQEQYQYILVDEHQDTNNSQNSLLEMLASFHEQPNLFVVGDTKQAIFRFQGASLENFKYFKAQYPSAELIVLTDNYRSTQPILDVADSLLHGPEPLEAKTAHIPEQIGVAAFSSSDAEAWGVEKEIAKLLESGVVPNEIAVLYRDNKDAFIFATMLERFGIPFQIESNQDVLDDTEIRKLVTLLRAISDFGNEEFFIRALHIDFLEVHPFDISQLLGASGRRRSIFSFVKSESELDALGLDNPKLTNEVYRRIAGWAKASNNLPLLALLEVVIRESGFLSNLLAQDDPAEQLDRLQGFFGAAASLVERKRGATLKDFLSYLDTLVAHKILVRAGRMSVATKRVRLMTAHRSKGLEFEYVIVVRAFDGHWGNKIKREYLPLPDAVYAIKGEAVESDGALDDERRLFYVALTRAKKSILITYSREGEGGREQLPSMFLEEIGRDLLVEHDVSDIEKDFSSEREVLFAPRIRSGADVRDPDFIAEIFHKNGLSVTALNNFLICPWRYYYRNLLRVPEAPSPHQMYGMAMHAALRAYFDALSSPTRVDVPDAKFLLSHFENELARQPLDDEAFEHLRLRGTKALSGYIKNYSDTFNAITINEFTIGGVLLDIKGIDSSVRLTGKLDKVELYDDYVVVVDYKTGKPKSRNFIEGKTKNSDGGIKRQLIFYKLLLNLYEDNKYKMREGVIDFVEPDEKSGKYKKERFEVLDEEVNELMEVICDVSKQILTASFFDSRCDDKKCEYCELRKMLG